MMNKGLEVIEASRLFGIEGERIRIVVHPQSVAHGFVVFSDGSVKSQLAAPDMRVPIGYALAYPETTSIASGLAGIRSSDRRIADRWAPRTDEAALRYDFEAPDPARFPCVRARLRGAGRRRHAAGRALGCKRSRGRARLSKGGLPLGGFAEVIEGTMAVPARRADAGRGKNGRSEGAQSRRRDRRTPSKESVVEFVSRRHPRRIREGPHVSC